MRFKVIPILISTLVLILSFFYACTKKDVFPIEPQISLILPFEKITDLKGVDSVGIIKLYFTDGDGDIGLLPSQNTGQYLYDIFIKYFEKKNGKFEEVILTYTDSQTGITDTLWFHGRIPYLTPLGKSKAISGEISDTLPINNFGSPYDTIKYQIYIQDRALNKSNVIETPPIIVNKKALKP